MAVESHCDSLCPHLEQLTLLLVLELVGTTLTPRIAPQKEKDNRTKAPVIFIGLLLPLNFVVSRFVFLYFA